jgi:hypothetical protein
MLHRSTLTSDVSNLEGYQLIPQYQEILDHEKVGIGVQLAAPDLGLGSLEHLNGFADNLEDNQAIVLLV